MRDEAWSYDLWAIGRMCCKDSRPRPLSLPFSVRSVTPTLQSIAERAKFPKREWIASFSADSWSSMYTFKSCATKLRHVPISDPSTPEDTLDSRPDSERMQEDTLRPSWILVRVLLASKVEVIGCTAEASHKRWPTARRAARARLAAPAVRVRPELRRAPAAKQAARAPQNAAVVVVVVVAAVSLSTAHIMVLASIEISGTGTAGGITVSVGWSSNCNKSSIWVVFAMVALVVVTVLGGVIPTTQRREDLDVLFLLIRVAARHSRATEAAALKRLTWVLGVANPPLRLVGWAVFTSQVGLGVVTWKEGEAETKASPTVTSSRQLAASKASLAAPCPLEDVDRRMAHCV